MRILPKLNLCLMIAGMALVSTGCELEEAGEFACSRQYSDRSKVEACKTGIELAAEIRDQDDANVRCAERYDMAAIRPDSDDAFDRLVAESGLFEACARGVKGYLDYQDPAQQDFMERHGDAGVPAGVPRY